MPSLAKYRLNRGRSVQFGTIFLLFLVCKILYSSFWVERMFQASAQRFPYNSYFFFHLKIQLSYNIYNLVHYYRH